MPAITKSAKILSEVQRVSCAVRERREEEEEEEGALEDVLNEDLRSGPAVLAEVSLTAAATRRK